MPRPIQPQPAAPRTTPAPEPGAPATGQDVGGDRLPASRGGDENREAALDEALEETFPASDPISIHSEE